MKRVKDALMAQDRGPTIGRTNAMANILVSGQNGYMPDLTILDGAANHVKRPLIALLVNAPRGFKDLPDPDAWIGGLKALVERHPQRIDGLRSALNVETQDVALSGAGEMQQDVSNITRERSEPVFTWVEKYGKPIKALLEGWIINLLGDPNNKVPMVVTRGLADRVDLLPTYVGATILFIEPDPSHTRVVEAWLCTNMYPLTTGPIEGSRDLTAGGETIEMSINFTAVTQYTYGVREWAQRILSSISLANANPNNAPAFVDKIDADVVRQTDSGYTDQINDASRTFSR